MGFGDLTVSGCHRDTDGTGLIILGMIREPIEPMKGT